MKIKSICLLAIASSLLLASELTFAVTINYSKMDFRKTHQVPGPPITQTTVNPDVGDGPELVTTPSSGFTTAMTNSVSADDWFQAAGPISGFNYTGSLTGIFWIDVYRANATPGAGSCSFLLHYERGASDPAASDLFWIQTVDTSLRGNNVPANEDIPYPDIYASSYPNGGKLPFYFRPDETVLDNNPYVGNANIRSSSFTINGDTRNYDMAFWDQPSRPIFNFWRGELFLASYTDTNNDTVRDTVTVYDGVRWGFDVVPEPGSLVFIAGMGIFVMRRRT